MKPITISFFFVLLLSSSAYCQPSFITKEMRPNASRLHRKASLAFRKGNYDRAKDILTKIENLRQLGNIERFCLEFLAAEVIANADCDYEKSIRKMHQCLRIARSERSPRMERLCLSRLGDLWNHKGNCLRAARFQKKSLDIARKIGSRHDINDSLLALAEIYITMGACNRAESMLSQLDISNTSWQREIEQTVRGKLSFKRGEFATAIEILLPIFELGMRRGQLNHEAQLCLGQAYLHQGKLNLARKAFQSVLDEGDIKSRTVVSRAFLGLADIAMQRNQFEEALQLLDRIPRNENAAGIQERVLAQKVNCAYKVGDALVADEVFRKLNERYDDLTEARFADEMELLDERTHLPGPMVKPDSKNFYQARRQFEGLAMIFSVLSIIGTVLGARYFYGNRLEQQRLKHHSRLQELENRLHDSLLDKSHAQADQHQLEQNEHVRRSNQIHTKRDDEAITKLTGELAHNFNNLLMVVNNVNETIKLQMGSRLPAGLCELIACSDRAVESGTELTRRLRAFAKRRILDPTKIDLKKCLQENEAILRKSAGENHPFKLDVKIESWIVADESELISTLKNLCANCNYALAGQPNPLVRIKASEMSLEEWQADQRFEHFVSPNLIRPNKSLVVITVSDNGCGILSEEIHQVCDPFYSTKKTAKGINYGGTGLGLCAVKGFLEQSGAGLDIRSEPGSGTTVRMTFPRAIPAQFNQAQKAANPLDQNVEGVRVILVDDNEPLLSTLKVTLEGLGCIVFSFTGGRAAQEHLVTNRGEIDLVISDVRMPGEIDGYELACWVQDHCDSLPVLLMTGFDQRHHESEFNVIHKPFDRDEILAWIAMIKKNST